MKPRDLVFKLFEQGFVKPLPIQIECNNKIEEIELSDTFGVSVPIEPWCNYFIHGGPFSRKSNEDLLKWCSRIESSELELPEISEVINKAVNYFRKVIEEYKPYDKFIVFKLLGPTEASEMTFAPEVPPEYRDYEQSFHRFEFAMFLKLRPRKAIEIYEKIAKYIYEIIKVICEIDIVDGIRIADDVADYKGVIYGLNFVENYYLKWHIEYANLIKKKGKIAMLHTDGNIESICTKLANIYNGVHPFDLTKRLTIEDAFKWIEKLKSLKPEVLKTNSKFIFITGIPIELLFLDFVGIDKIREFITKFLNDFGAENLLLSTTHRPYPKRSYTESTPREKVLYIRKIVNSLT